MCVMSWSLSQSPDLVTLEKYHDCQESPVLNESVGSLWQHG